MKRPPRFRNFCARFGHSIFIYIPNANEIVDDSCLSIIVSRLNLYYLLLSRDKDGILVIYTSFYVCCSLLTGPIHRSRQMFIKVSNCKKCAKPSWNLLKRICCDGRRIRWMWSKIIPREQKLVKRNGNKEYSLWTSCMMR